MRLWMRVVSSGPSFFRSIPACNQVRSFVSFLISLRSFFVLNYADKLSMNKPFSIRQSKHKEDTTPRNSSEKSVEKENGKEKPKVRKVELKFNLDQFFNRCLLFFLIFLLFLPFFFSVFIFVQKERISLSQMVYDLIVKKVVSLSYYEPDGVGK